MSVKVLSRDQVRAYYDRFGSKQDSQGFYEDPATEDMVKHGMFSEAQAVFEFGCETSRFAEKLLEQHVPSNGQDLGIDLGPSRMLKKSASGVLGPLSCSRTPVYAPRANGPAALLDGPF